MLIGQHLPQGPKSDYIFGPERYVGLDTVG